MSGRVQGVQGVKLFRPSGGIRALIVAWLACVALPLAAQEPDTLTEESVFHEYGYVTMPDGTRLAYVVWRPSENGNYPTLLNYDSYGAGALPFAKIRAFLEVGYAVVGVNVRGTGCSEGDYSFLGPLEGPDGAVVVEWAAEQAWSNGNVGMYGCSNGGASQLPVAAQHPPHLKAITPYVAPASLYREFAATTGGMIHLGAAADWTFNIQPNLANTGIDARVASGDKQCLANTANRSAATSFYQDVLDHPLQDQWWEARAIENIAEDVEVPTLLMGNWQDAWDMPDGGLRVFQLISSDTKKLIMNNGHHCSEARVTADSAIMRWLDRWVKGERNGVDDETSVEIGWEIDGNGGGWKTRYSAWPVPGTEKLTFHLTVDGELQQAGLGERVAEGVRRYIYPMGTELFGSNEHFSLAPLSAGLHMGGPLAGSLSYRTDPMESDLAILGAPILTLYFSSEQHDTSFLFTLKDIDDDGNVLFLQRAYLRASLREVDATRSTDDYIAHSFRKIQELTPGEVYEAKLSIGALGHVVRKGHRLELSIQAPSEIPSPVMGSAPLGGPSINRVYQSSQYPTTVVIPVVPGEVARAPAPQCGQLPGQPCRPARVDAAHSQ